MLGIATKKLEPDTSSGKPDGGYVQISALSLGLLWWCYSEGVLSLRAVRVGLALFELRLRRVIHAMRQKKRGRAPEFTPKYTVGQVADFCGLPQKRARAALNELVALGFLAELPDTRIAFAR